MNYNDYSDEELNQKLLEAYQTPELPDTTPSLGQGIAMGFAGLGDAISSAYGGQKTNFLGSTMGSIEAGNKQERERILEGAKSKKDLVKAALENKRKERENQATADYRDKALGIKQKELMARIEANKIASEMKNAQRAQADAFRLSERDYKRMVDQRNYDEKIATKQEAKKKSINEIEQRRRDIEDNLSTLEKMIKNKGTYETFGSHNQDMERLTDQIATDMAKLMDPESVARPGEVELVKRGLVQPGFKNTNNTALDVLKNFRGEVNRRVGNAYEIRGLSNPGPSQQKYAEKSNSPSVINEAQASGGFPRYVRKDGKRALIYNTQELSEALDEGWK